MTLLYDNRAILLGKKFVGYTMSKVKINMVKTIRSGLIGFITNKWGQFVINKT